MILVLDPPSMPPPFEQAPSHLALHLLAPEPRLRKCSQALCLRRLGVYLPRRRGTRKPKP